MNQAELNTHINRILEDLSQKRTVVVREFRKKLEEKGIIHLRGTLNQK